MTSETDLQAQIDLLQNRISELEGQMNARPFIADIKFQERLDREAFFYKVFRALSFNAIKGDYVEFGCHGGTTFSLAYHSAQLHKHKAHLWAFDSFQGFPKQRDEEDDHPKWVEGRMSTSLQKFTDLCDERGLPRDAYTVVPGFYSDSLPALKQDEAPDNIALVYIDCDLYSSTQDVLKFLQPRLKHGMVIALDDYYCWSETQAAGERVALEEFMEENPGWELIPYLQFGWHGLAFVLHSKDVKAVR